MSHNSNDNEFADPIRALNKMSWRLDRSNHTITSNAKLDAESLGNLARMLTSLTLKTVKLIPSQTSTPDIIKDALNISLNKDGNLQFTGEDSLRALAQKGLNFPESSNYRIRQR